MERIDVAKAAGTKWTYVRIVVDFGPQKDDPNQICTVVGYNLIKY
jgi:hypothetical protein